MTDPTDKPDVCDCCGYRTGALKPYQGQFGEYRHGQPSLSKWYCDLCAGSRAADALRYPGQYPNQVAIMQTVCYVGNAILDALKKP